MPRYIDEENLIRRMHTMAKDKNYPPYADIFKSFAFKVFKDLLMSEPTADVQEVKHGKWMLHIEGFPEYDDPCNEYECSNCGCYDVFSPSKEVPYCPYCGAKMDGKEN